MRSQILMGGIIILSIVSSLKLNMIQAEEVIIKWRGFISPYEKRIKDYKSELTVENPNLPTNYHLYFQELQGDYAVFYDLDGHTIHFKYRRNKWDEENTKKYHYLLSGRSYRLKAEFLGIFYYPRNLEDRRLATRVFLPASQELDWRLVSEKSSLPVYELKEATESYTDAIIF